MRISYHPDQETLYIRFRDTYGETVARTEQIGPDTGVDFDNEGRVTLLAITAGASEKVDLSKILLYGLRNADVWLPGGSV